MSADKFPTFSRIGRVLRQCTLYFGRFVRRWAKPALFTLICLATAIGLFVAEENYRTGKVWEKYQVEARARGEKLTVAELAPSPVPDDQNFAMTPLLKSIYTDPKNISKWHERFSALSNEGQNISFGNWETGQPTEWTASEQAALLANLKKGEVDMAEISLASRRPYSRFPVSYDQQPPSMILLPHIGPMLEFSNFFEMRALLELKAGQTDRAVDDTITIFQLAQSLKDEPTLVSLLTRVAILNRGIQVVWDGLAINCWSEPQLAMLQQELQKLDLFPQFLHSMEGERAFFLNSLEWMKSQGNAERLKFFKSISGTDLAKNFLAALPVFALTRAQTEGAEYFDADVLPVINVEERRINPELGKAAEDAFMRLTGPRSPWLHPQVVFEQTFFQDLKNLMTAFARHETGLDEAMVACALERYKMTRGEYPAKLDELVPGFIAKLPTDVVSRESLHYQRTADGRFMLYSVGWDDERIHGPPGVFVTEENSWKDWVWAYTPVK